MAQDDRTAEPKEFAFTRAVRALAVLVFAATAFFPVRACSPGPGDFEPHARGPTAQDFAGGDVPVDRVRAEVSRGFEDGGVVGAVWGSRNWYPYLLAPLWIAALVAASSGFPRARRAAGVGLLVVSVAIAALEAPFLFRDFTGVLPPAARPFELAAAYVAVCAVLFLRPAGRGLLDPEATVSSQALLGLLHAATFPLGDAQRWLPGHTIPAIGAALATSYRPAFWVALAALAFAAACAYAPSRRRAPVLSPDPEPVSV
jgi:hypothetical protein